MSDGLGVRDNCLKSESRWSERQATSAQVAPTLTFRTRCNHAPEIRITESAAQSASSLGFSSTLPSTSSCQESHTCTAMGADGAHVTCDMRWANASVSASNSSGTRALMSKQCLSLSSATNCISSF